MLHVTPQFAAPEAEIGITAGADELALTVFGKDASGRDAQITVSSSGTDSNRKLKGTLRLPVDLAHQLRLAGGQPVAEGQGAIELGFEADGRSPGGALSTIRGSGAYDFADVRLLGLSPEAFGRVLAEAKDSAGITAAFDALRGGEGLALGRVAGSITVTNGEAAFLPFSLKTEAADVQIKTVAELALGEIDADVTVALKARDDLPVMSVSYAGPPSALARSEDNTELSTKLGVTIMQQGIDELERLQQEQKRLAEEEEKQRIADEARLQAYYAQRDELLLRKRELKVHAEVRVAEAERLRKQIETERAANAEISKGELKQRVREIRLYRRLARVTQQAPKKPVAPPKPARVIEEAQTVGPVILAKPEGAPVIISPPPGLSPTQ